MFHGLKEQVFGPQNAVAMADALRAHAAHWHAMPHLRSLSLVADLFDGTDSGNIFASVACKVQQGCSAQPTSLVCHDISVDDDQPPQQLARLSAALMRLTGLQVLNVPHLAHTLGVSGGTCTKDQYALAAAAVAAGLPHLPALTELDARLCYRPSEPSSITRSAIAR